MPNFTYTARGRQGEMLHGQITANSDEEALAALQSQGLIVTAVRLDRSAKRAVRAVRKQHQRIAKSDLVLLSKQLSTLLESGIPLTRALTVLKEQCESRLLETVLADLLHEVESGAPLHEALKRHPRVFNNFWVNLVKAGETGGQLSGSLEQIAKYLESARQLEQKIVSAMMYPAVLVVVAIGAVAVFLLKIVPIFSGLFSQFGVELPLITKIVIGISGVLQQTALWGILITGAVIFLVRRWRATPVGRTILDGWMLQLPLAGQLAQYSEVARFANSLSTLLLSGVPILQALEIVQAGSSNVIFTQAIDVIRTSVREGHGIAKTMAENGVFPGMVVQMVQAGEEIGQVAQMLKRVAAYYEERAEVLLHRMTTLFEPIVLVVMGALIGVIVVAMYLPLFNLSQMSHR